MKRFWEASSVREGPDGFEVLLDGRPMRLPGGPSLRLRSAALAAAVAAEWQVAGGAPGGEMGFEAVPLTRLAGTAQERVAADPGASVSALLRFGACDLLCYRAERPEALVVAQAAAWDPLLGWAAEALGARLRVAAGVTFVEQPAAALAALGRALEGFGPMGLAGLGVAVPALGSLVLGLGLAAGRIDAGAAHALATLDDRFEIAAWGEDAEATARLAGLAADVALAARFVELAGAGA